VVWNPRWVGRANLMGAECYSQIRCYDFGVEMFSLTSADFINVYGKVQIRGGAEQQVLEGASPRLRIQRPVVLYSCTKFYRVILLFSAAFNLRSSVSLDCYELSILNSMLDSQTQLLSIIHRRHHLLWTVVHSFPGKASKHPK
jgi:hypothetical protein